MPCCWVNFWPGVNFCKHFLDANLTVFLMLILWYSLPRLRVEIFLLQTHGSLGFIALFHLFSRKYSLWNSTSNQPIYSNDIIPGPPRTCRFLEFQVQVHCSLWCRGITVKLAVRFPGLQTNNLGLASLSLTCFPHCHINSASPESVWYFLPRKAFLHHRDKVPCSIHPSWAVNLFSANIGFSFWTCHVFKHSVSFATARQKLHKIRYIK